MRKRSDILIDRLLSCGLALVLILSPAASVFAAEDGTAEQDHSSGQPVATNVQENSPEQAVTPAATEPATTEPAEAEPAAPEQTAEEISSPALLPDAVTETPADVTETAEPEPVQNASGDAITTDTADNDSAGTKAVRTLSAPAPVRGTASSSSNATAASVRIGTTTFGTDEDVSSQWSEGKGWKNIAG